MGQKTHVIPLNDLIEHDNHTEDCPCGPTLERVESDTGDGWVFIHHSLDGREQHE